MVALARLAPGAGTVLLGPARVVAERDVVQLVAAAQVLVDARAEAAALLASAAAAAGQIRAEAHAEGAAAAEAEVQDRLFEIAEASVDALSRTEERIVDLALQVAERVMGQLDGQDVVARMALRSLRLAGRSAMVRLRVAPALAEGLRRQLETELSATMQAAAIEVVPDPRVRDHGCIMETDAGLVDATIESQIAAVRRGLQRALTRSGG